MPWKRMASGALSPLILKHTNRRTWKSNFTTLSLYPHSQSEHFKVKTNPLPLLGIKPRSQDCLICVLVTILTPPFPASQVHPVTLETWADVTGIRDRGLGIQTRLRNEGIQGSNPVGSIAVSLFQNFQIGCEVHREDRGHSDRGRGLEWVTLCFGSPCLASWRRRRRLCRFIYVFCANAPTSYWNNRVWIKP
jgi:hypothetical protein